jgi:threonylcarbamoyladenosine tRNA methylthiotransferase MtaB
VVLTGVDITAYGADLPGRPSLGRLVRSILRRVPGLRRLRLSSLDTVECDAELLRAIGEEERLMPHFHLSLQAGDDLILKRMKRRHGRAQAVAFCERVRAVRADAVFGADLIAGFPTETEEMFGRSLRLVEECGLVFLHVFPFSPRPGTPAARMPQVPPKAVQERAQRLRAEGARMLGRYLAGEAGKVRGVLFESPRRGRTEHYVPVETDRDAPAGAVLDVRIGGPGGPGLQGTLAA